MACTDMAEETGTLHRNVNFEQAGLILAGSCYGLLLLGLAVEYSLQKDIFPPGFFENECFFIQLHSTPFARYS